jgi:hypothetical protein
MNVHASSVRAYQSRFKPLRSLVLMDFRVESTCLSDRNDSDGFV